jgi:hypothetical protein
MDTYLQHEVFDARRGSVCVHKRQQRGIARAAYRTTMTTAGEAPITCRESDSGLVLSLLSPLVRRLPSLLLYLALSREKTSVCRNSSGNPKRRRAEACDSLPGFWRPEKLGGALPFKAAGQRVSLLLWPYSTSNADEQPQ